MTFKNCWVFSWNWVPNNPETVLSSLFSRITFHWSKGLCTTSLRGLSDFGPPCHRCKKCNFSYLADGFASFFYVKKKKLTLKVCCWFKLFSLCCRWREAVSIFHKPSWHRRSTQTLLASDITQNSAAWYIKYKKRKASNKKTLCRFYLLQEELFCCQVVLQLSQRWVTCDSVSHKMLWEQYTWTLDPTGGSGECSLAWKCCSFES